MVAFFSGGYNGSLKNAFEVRDAEGTVVLVLSAKTSTDRDKWIKSFTREREVVQHDLESGKCQVMKVVLVC